MNNAIKEILSYVFAGVLLIIGLLLLRSGIKKNKPEDKVTGRILPVSGMGSRFHYIYSGVGCILIAVYFIFQETRG